MLGTVGVGARSRSSHHVVLAELSGITPGGDDLIVITAAWSDITAVSERAPDLVTALPNAEPWMSVLVERDDDGTENWTHLFTSRAGPIADDLDPLFRLVAEDGTAG